MVPTLHRVRGGNAGQVAVRRFRVDKPCPELGLVMMEALGSVQPGEVFEVVSRWRYVVEDLRAAASSMGLEVLAVEETGEGYVVRLKRKH